MRSNPRYWFPAKTYGWGWGLPSAWQGWAVLLCYAAIASWLGLHFLATDRPIAFFVGMGVATVALVAVCLAKGEPPQWRWGKRT